MSEPVQEMIDRLELLGSGDREADLSDNDMRAINWAVGEIDKLRSALETIAHDHQQQAIHCMDKSWSEALGWAQDIARTALTAPACAPEPNGEGSTRYVG